MYQCHVCQGEPQQAPRCPQLLSKLLAPVKEGTANSQTESNMSNSFRFHYVSLLTIYIILHLSTYLSVSNLAAVCLYFCQSVAACRCMHPSIHPSDIIRPPSALSPSTVWCDLYSPMSPIHLYPIHAPNVNGYFVFLTFSLCISILHLTLS